MVPPFSNKVCFGTSSIEKLSSCWKLKIYYCYIKGKDPEMCPLLEGSEGHSIRDYCSSDDTESYLQVLPLSYPLRWFHCL